MPVMASVGTAAHCDEGGTAVSATNIGGGGGGGASLEKRRDETGSSLGACITALLSDSTTHPPAGTSQSTLQALQEHDHLQNAEQSDTATWNEGRAMRGAAQSENCTHLTSAVATTSDLLVCRIYLYALYLMCLSSCSLTGLELALDFGTARSGIHHGCYGVACHILWPAAKTGPNALSRSAANIPIRSLGCRLSWHGVRSQNVE